MPEQGGCIILRLNLPVVAAGLDDYRSMSIPNTCLLYTSRSERHHEAVAVPLYCMFETSDERFRRRK